MSNIFKSARAHLNRRVEYNRTVSELSALSPSVQRDLGIAEADVRKIAHRAIYGY
jgi:uncharacterized protein YjiS (DUF1127 family)